MLKIAIGTDHRGFALKQALIAQLVVGDQKVTWTDCGTYTAERTDYPLFAIPVCELVQHKEVNYGILLCGTGVGMSIIANRFSGIYAGLAWSEQIARLNKQDDNVNILILPADFVTLQSACEIISAWLSAEFKENRYRERIHMIDQINSTER